MKSNLHYWFFAVIAVILISGCVQEPPSSIPQLGNLCSGSDECNNFCKDNLARCKEYCKNKPENPLCQKPFAFEMMPTETSPTPTHVSTTTPTSTPTTVPSCWTCSAALYSSLIGDNICDSQCSENTNPASQCYSAACVQQATPSPITPTLTPSPVQSPSSGCKGKGAVSFTSPPMRIEDVGHIIPLGQMSGGHVTPTDHGYYHPPNWKPQEIEDTSKFRDVLAPADGIITDIGIVESQRDYRLVIRHTCTFYTIYIHVKELSPRISQFIGNASYKGTSIAVAAGEVIGMANGFDFSVHDDEVMLKGFMVPSHYDAESWKIHTADMFAYFVEPLRAQLLAKNVRQAEPRGGKIDYDIDGKLVGNWFVEGTGGYRGGGYGGSEPYWTTHLSFAYNWLDPSLIIVSIGNFNGEARQFAVKGNAPDPATVSTASGLVKYELVDWEYITEGGGWWDRISFAKISRSVEVGQVSGVALVQMTGDRKIKFEVFQGKTASEVGFTNNAKIYER